MTRIVLILICCGSVLTGIAQKIDQRQADSLVRLLKSAPEHQRPNLLLRLAQYHILKPGELPADFDSAQRLLTEVSRISGTQPSHEINGRILLTRSLLEKEKGHSEQARRLVDQSVILLEKSDAYYALGQAYQERAGYYDHNDEQQRAIKVSLMQKAADAYGRSGEKSDQAYCLVYIAELYHLFDRADEAVSILKTAISIYDSIRYPYVQSVYDVLGNIYLMKSNYFLAMRYELRALQAAEQTGDSSMLLGKIYMTLGSIQSQLSLHEEALSSMKQALGVAVRHRDRSAVPIYLMAIGRTFNTLNRQQDMLKLLSTISPELLQPDGNILKTYMAIIYADAYNGTGQYKQADRYSDTLWQLAADPQMPPLYKSSIYRTLSWFYLRRQNFAAMRKCLTLNTDLTRQLGIAKLISFNHLGLYRLDSALGNFKSAFYNLKLHKSIEDSLFNVTKSSQIQQLQVEYETDKKEDSIRQKNMDILLLTRTNKLQQENLRQAALLRNITIAGIALALILSGVFYRQYKNKQKSNQLISEQNRKLQHLVSEKEWLLKEVHHRVKNNLQTVISLLELQSEYLSSDALAAVQDSQNRIYATSLLHQKLYQEEHASAVDMSVYVPELVQYLKEAYDTGSRIRFQLLVDPIRLDVSQAVPVGLILNELITNAIKYAFHQPARPPVITITFQLHGAALAEMVVTDNGSGLPAGRERQGGGLGLKLVRGLAEDMGGVALFEGHEGTRVVTRFTLKTSLLTLPETAVHPT